MKTSRRMLKGSRRLARREFSFGMRKKIRYRTAFEPIVIAYAILAFLLISFIAVIQGDYDQVPVFFYVLALIGFVFVEAYSLGGKNFDP